MTRNDLAAACAHPGDWAPEALTFGGPLAEAMADVVCMHPGCDWSGRVPFAAITTDPGTDPGSCPDCAGTGTAWSDVYDDWAPCRRCGGSGETPEPAPKEG